MGMTIEGYLNGLRASFAPERTRGRHAVLQYVFSGTQRGECFARVSDGSLETGMGRCAEPTATVETDFELWMQLVTYEGDLLIAYQEGRYRVEGDVETLLEADAWFPRAANA